MLAVDEKPSDKTPETDVLVVGAGAVGLTAAIELARRGVRIRVIDREGPRSRRESRALGLQARTLEVLERLGVIDEALAAGRPIRGFSYHIGPRPLLRLQLRRLDAPYPFILLLPQGHLEEILIDRLANFGVTVERGVEATQLTQAADEVVVETRSPAPGRDVAEIVARYVVAADGGRSTVRHLLGANFRGAAFEGVIHLLDSDLEWAGATPAEDQGNFFAGTNTIVGLGRLSGPVWRVIAYLRPEDPRATGELTAEGMQSVLDEHPYLAARVRTVQWQSVYRVSNRMVDRLRHGRVFLAGDAAHIHSPMGGQGLNTGVQDAHNLAWKIAARVAGAPDSLLDTYEVERLPVIASVLRETSIGHRLISNHGRTLARPTAALLGRFAAPLLNAALTRPAVERRLSRATAQISVNYRRSPIVFDNATRAARAPSRLHAGDRAPDVARLLTADGTEARLHAVLAADTAHHLLAFAGLGATDAEITQFGDELDDVRTGYPDLVVHRVFRRGPHYQPTRPHPDDLQDLEGNAHDRYESRSGGAYLVRPDGYIAARVSDVGELPADIVCAARLEPVVAPESAEQQ